MPLNRCYIITFCKNKNKCNFIKIFFFHLQYWKQIKETLDNIDEPLYTIHSIYNPNKSYAFFLSIKLKALRSPKKKACIYITFWGAGEMKTITCDVWPLWPLWIQSNTLLNRMRCGFISTVSFLKALLALTETCHYPCGIFIYQFIKLLHPEYIMFSTRTPRFNDITKLLSVEIETNKKYLSIKPVK